MNRTKQAFLLLILPLLISACASTKEIRAPPQLTFEEPILSKGIEDRETTACAERTALVKAVSEGEREFDTIALAISSSDVG